MADLSNEQKIQLFDEVSKDKGLYRQIVKKLADAHPETYIPEVELGNQIEAAKAEHATALESLRAELQAEKDARVAAEALIKIKQEHGVDDAQLGEVAQFMQQNHIEDFDAGLKFKRLSDAEAVRANTRIEDRTSMKLPAQFAEAVKNRRGYRRKKLYEGIDELRKQGARAAILATN